MAKEKADKPQEQEEDRTGGNSGFPVPLFNVAIQAPSPVKGATSV